MKLEENDYTGAYNPSVLALLLTLVAVVSIVILIARKIDPPHRKEIEPKSKGEVEQNAIS